MKLLLNKENPPDCEHQSDTILIVLTSGLKFTGRYSPVSDTPWGILDFCTDRLVEIPTETVKGWKYV